MDDDELRELERWVRIINARGYANMFAKETVEDQTILERVTAMEWCKSASEKYGLEAGGVISGPHPKSPPDCYAKINGTTSSLELTEMVDSDLLKDIESARAAGHDVSVSNEPFFSRSLWTAAKLALNLNRCIDRKDQKYLKNSVSIDVLIIHSDERWLLPEDAERWLRAMTFRHRATISSAYLLLTYTPGYSTNWPVFRLY